ncbi:MAG: tetratricopeptide repeat protein [Myxococcales bacterium]|nr:tetratricopeptide repeat protein [Myxococcales bacterium]
MSARAAGRIVETLLGVVEPLFADRLWLTRRRAQALVTAGEAERAMLYLHGALARRPDDPWLHFYAGRAAQGRELRRQARARFAHAVALSPAEPTFRFALGYTLRQEGHLDAAAREYRVALRTAPGEPSLLFNLGVVERDRGHLDVAQALLERVVQKWPRDVRALYTLGVCAFERKDFEAAERALDEAGRRDRRHHKARYQRALLLLEDNHQTEALTDLRAVLKQVPDYGPAHYALGRALAENEPTRARVHLREALLGRPPVLRAHLDLGRLLEQAGHLAEARAEYVLYARHHPEKRTEYIARRLAALDVALAEGARP